MERFIAKYNIFLPGFAYGRYLILTYNTGYFSAYVK